MGLKDDRRRERRRLEERERKLALLLTGAEVGEGGRLCEDDLRTPPPFLLPTSVTLRARWHSAVFFHMRESTPLSFSFSFSFISSPAEDGCFELDDNESDGVGDGDGDSERGMKKPITLSIIDRARLGRASGSTMSGSSSVGGCGLSSPTTRTIGGCKELCRDSEDLCDCDCGCGCCELAAIGNGDSGDAGL